MFYKILAVDDNMLNLKMLEEYFSQTDYKIILETNNKNIEKIIDEESPDIILLDLFMPDKNGYEVLTDLRSNRNYDLIPVIMVTADNRIDSIEKCLEHGAFDYIVKPVDFLELKARINSAIKYVDITKRLIKKEKNEAFFATVVSANHEINQPLTVLKGSMQMLELFFRKDFEKNQSILKHMKKSFDSIVIIEEILNKMKYIKDPAYTKYLSNIQMINIPEDNSGNE
jgi:DNA-binding response OmpR family regulator